MVQERVKMQPELVAAYPDLPLFDASKIRTFTDYAYMAHDQAEFLVVAMNEIKSMHESHFMTRKNKELIKEKKMLEEELSLAKSIGPGQGQTAVDQIKAELDASQKAH